MALKRPRNSLKRPPNVLKPARNCVSFLQREAIFPRKWIADKGLPLCHTNDVNKACLSHDLRPITSFDARLIIHNTLPKLEMRQPPAAAGKFRVLYKISRTRFGPTTTGVQQWLRTHPV